MNIRQSHFSSCSGEALERLSVFLPASVVRTLKEQVPAGSRGRFIAEALRRALEAEKAENERA